MTRIDEQSLAGARWRTSSYSGGGNQCVEVARIGTVIAVRDSKDPAGGYLAFEPAEWEAFLTGIKHGDFHL